MKIDERTSRGGTPATYSEVLLAARRALSSEPGIAGTVPTSRVTSRLVVGSVIDEDPGGGPLSFWCRFRVPASLSTNAGICALSPSETHILASSGSDPNDIGLGIISGDVNLFMGNSSTYTRYPLGCAGLVGQVVDVVITRNGGLAAYVNGTAVTLTGVDVNGGVAANATIKATWAHALAPLSATISNSNNSIAGPISRFVAFNYALSAADAASLIANGVSPADQWGRKAAVYTSSFSAGVDSWSGFGASAVAGNVDGIGGQNDNLELTAGATSDQLAQRVGTLTIGKRYRWTFSAYRPASNATTTGILLQPRNNFGAPVAPRAFQLTADTWTTVSVDVPFAGSTPTNNGIIYYMINSLNGVSGLTIGDRLYTRAHSVVQLGAFLDLQFDDTIGFQAGDRANNRVATLYNGAGFTQPDSTQGFAHLMAQVPGGERFGGSSGIVIPTNASISRVAVRNINLGAGRTFNLGDASGALTNIISAAPLGDTGTVTEITPGATTSSTGQLWASYTGTGSVEVTVYYERFRP